MSDSVLTAEEIDALRQEMPKSSRQPEEIDLARSDRQLRRRLAGVERRLDLLARSIKATLSQFLRTPCAGAPPPVEVIGPQAGQASLQSSALTFRLQDAGGAPLGFAGLDAPLCFRVVEAAFGAPVVPNSAVPERKDLTAVERDTLTPLYESLAGQISEHLATPQLAVSVQLTTLPPELPKECETLVRWHLDADGAGGLGGVTLLLLASWVERSSGSSSPAPTSGHQQIAAALRIAAVELSATLGSAELPLAELLALRIGDVLRLDRNQNESVPVLVEGITKFLAQPVQQGGVYGVKIERSLG